MDPSVAAAFVALGLCIPLIVVVFGLRVMRLFSLLDRGRGPGGKGRKPPPPLGGNPYHLP